MLPATATKLLATVDNVKVPNRGVKMHFQGFKRNWPEFHYYMKEHRHHLPHAWKIHRTRTRKYPGHIDVYDKQGNREGLEAALLRFKRLDFGAYVNVAIGRRNRFHRLTPYEKIRREQHCFTWHRFP